LTADDLIDRCKIGERDAQRELFERTANRVYRLLLRMVGNPDDALDLTQDTYVKGFLALAQFDGRSQIDTWFYRIAINNALQFQRRGATARRRSEEIFSKVANEAQPTTTELRLDLESAMSRLCPEDRLILLLRYQDELDYGAIAQVLQCSGGTVASRLNRARNRLRVILGESYG